MYLNAISILACILLLQTDRETVESLDLLVLLVFLVHLDLWDLQDLLADTETVVNL